MLDQTMTYLIVLSAAAFVIWTLLLPLRYKIMIRHAASGKIAPCALEPHSGLCGTGCAGCSLAAPKTKARPPVSRVHSPSENGRT